MNAVYNSNTPYQVGGCLPEDAPSYVIRKADDELFNWLLKGEFCYVLNSRQMGKSSLRVRTMKRLQEAGFACAVIDITAIGTQQITPENWYGALIKSLVNSFDLGEKFNLRAWWKERDNISAVHCFGEFIEAVLLREVSQSIVIFIDEIDSILRLEFKDNFLPLIRSFYNKRAEKSDYKRLSFVLLGVANPSDLIGDKTCTPFNVGRAVELCGFQLNEVKPLVKGLESKVKDAEAVLRKILAWTGGQPFLTQKVCQLVGNAEALIPVGDEAKWVEKLVKKHIIDNWKEQDDPEHLRTIKNRIISNDKRIVRCLGLYQHILQKGAIAADGSPEQMELRLSGLVVKQNGNLKAYNRIYKKIFALNWVEKELANLRPYSEFITAWLASNCQNESRLLREQELRDAQEWAKDKSLSDLDYQFLAASQELDKQDVKIALNAERKAKQILTHAHQKAKDIILIGGFVGLVIIYFVTLVARERIVEVNEDLANTQEKLTQVNEDLAETQEKLTKANQDLAKVNEDLAETQEKLTKANQDLAIVKAKFDNVKVALTGRQVKLIATELTVLIHSPNGFASGVIIGRNGNTYYVLTAGNVVRRKSQYQIETGDSSVYPINYSLVRRLPDVDLAVLQFSSHQNYGVATLANYELGTDETRWVFVFEWYNSRERGREEATHMFLSELLVSKERHSFLAKDSWSLTHGYDLLYTNINSLGMSGAPVFDSSGRVVGIHAAADAERLGFSKIDPGYSVGVSISNFLNLANKLDIERQLLKIETSAPSPIPEPKEIAEIAQAYLNRGVTYAELEKYDQALAYFNQALFLNPKDPQGYLNRGLTYAELQQYQKAIADYTKAIDINPQDASAYLNRGFAYRDLQQYQRAIADYTKAIDINPQYAPAYLNRGFAYADLQQSQKAINDGEKAAELYSKEGNIAGYQEAQLLQKLIQLPLDNLAR